MPDINPSVPVVGQPDSTEEPKVVTALTQLIAAVNDVDSDQIADGTVALADLATALQEALPKPGNLRLTAKATADSGWLLCDGSAVSRATYAALYAAIGDTYGAGDGTTTFNLPPFSGRVAMGAGTATGAAGATAHALGSTVGEETHTTTVAEMPSHTHAPSGPSNLFLQTVSGAATNLTETGGHIRPTGFAAATAAAGGDAAHNNLQPSTVVNYQIKT